jgi:hypothetical protein
VCSDERALLVWLAVQPSAVDSIHSAFTHTKEQLFKPFRFGQWARLAIVGLLAGEMGMGACSYRFPLDLPPSQSQPVLLPEILADHPLRVAIVIAAAVLAGLTVLVVFLYINSRMRFVLLDSILARQCRVRHFWRLSGEPAFRYFVWQILFCGASLLAIALVVAPPLLIVLAADGFQSPSTHLVPLILGGIAVALLLTVVIIALGLIQVLTKDFVVPQMALEGATVAEGWRRLWALIAAEKGDFAAYVGIKIALTIATSIVAGVIGFIVVLMLVLPVAGLGMVVMIAAQASGLAWNPVTIATAIVAAAAVVLAIIFLLSMISVPLTVFFPAYSVHFFAGHYPPLINALNSHQVASE